MAMMCLALYDAEAANFQASRNYCAHHQGQGLSFAENNVSFHDACVTDDLYEQALLDPESCRGRHAHAR